jgi:cytochrome c biogenesis factor
MVLSIIALVFIISAKTEFQQEYNFKPVRAALKPFSAHIIHLGIILILIGYVGSQNLEEVIGYKPDPDPDVYNPLVIGEKQEFGDYEFEFLGSEVEDNDGVQMDFEIIHVFIEVSQNGNVIGQVKITWKFSEAQLNYISEIQIQHTIPADLYFISNVFYSDIGGWIPANNQNQNVKFTRNDITMISLEVKVIPMMSALWGGLWISVAGIFLRVFADYGRPKRKDDDLEEEETKPKEVQMKDKYYEDLLEQELAMLDEPKIPPKKIRPEGKKRKETLRRAGPKNRKTIQAKVKK